MNQTVEQYQQAHSQAVAELRRVEAVLERARVPVSQGGLQAAQRALGDALAALAMGEQPEADVDHLRQAAQQALKDYQAASFEAELRVMALQRRQGEAQEAMQTAHGQLVAAKGAADATAKAAMLDEIRAVRPSLRESERRSEFARISGVYGVDVRKVEELWIKR